MKRFFPILLIISILINMFAYGNLIQSKKVDKHQAISLIFTYMHYLKNYSEYIDCYLNDPDDSLLNILIDQVYEMIMVSTSGNYSFKEMDPLYSSLIDINQQIEKIALKCKDGLNSIEDIEEIQHSNENLKEITKYFDEIRSEIFLGDLDSDYLVKNQLSITKYINDVLEKN